MWDIGWRWCYWRHVEKMEGMAMATQHSCGSGWWCCRNNGCNVSVTLPTGEVVVSSALTLWSSDWHDADYGYGRWLLVIKRKGKRKEERNGGRKKRKSKEERVNKREENVISM